jgi:hypothetical protein
VERRGERRQHQRNKEVLAARGLVRVIGGVEEGVTEDLGELSVAQRLGGALVLQQAEATDAAPEVAEDGSAGVVVRALTAQQQEVEARGMLSERDLGEDTEGRRSALLEKASEEDVPSRASFARRRVEILRGHEGEVTTRGGSARQGFSSPLPSPGG